MRTLSHGEAKAFYDWFGAWQDSQRFYEDAAVTDLIAHSDFGAAHAVFEFGCGTGRLADRLLANYLPPGCRYHAADVSATMVRLARERLARWGERVRVEQTSGAVALGVPAAGFDRFVVTYVLDLLSEDDIRGLLEEAHRILTPGETLPARIGGFIWRGVFSLSPKLLGGCRPVVTTDFLPPSAWSLRHHNVITRFGISSEVVVARREGGASGPRR